MLPHPVCCHAQGAGYFGILPVVSRLCARTSHVMSGAWSQGAGQIVLFAAPASFVCHATAY